MNHRIRAWGIRRPDGTLAGTAMWGGCVGFNGIALFPTREGARKKLRDMRQNGDRVLRYFELINGGRKFTVVPVKGTFEW